ncbi:MAG: hypothetical protein RLZZ171_547 [Cyanobacteriota bacterium]
MIISDLQYIESVDNSEVQGGSYYYGNYAKADANADAQAFGKYTNTYTNTYAVADAKLGVSLSGSKSFAEASY